VDGHQNAAGLARGRQGGRACEVAPHGALHGGEVTGLGLQLRENGHVNLQVT
jgi:hypothetical protein